MVHVSVPHTMEESVPIAVEHYGGSPCHRPSKNRCREPWSVIVVVVPQTMESVKVFLRADRGGIRESDLFPVPQIMEEIVVANQT